MIHLLNLPGWYYGALNGNAGMFPEEYVVPLARHELTNGDSKQVSILERLNKMRFRVIK